MKRATPSTLRWAATLIAVYGAALLLEAFWIGVAAQWSPAARAWREIHDPAVMYAQVATAITGALLIRWLLQGVRSAWVVAVWWTTLLAGGGLGLLLAGLVRGSVGRTFIAGHRVESGVGIVTWLCLAGAAACLWSRATRAFFRERSGADDRT